MLLRELIDTYRELNDLLSSERNEMHELLMEMVDKIDKYSHATDNDRLRQYVSEVAKKREIMLIKYNSMLDLIKKEHNV